VIEVLEICLVSPRILFHDSSVSDINPSLFHTTFYVSIGIACILMLLRWFKDDLSADVGTAMTIDEVRQRQEFVSSIGSQSIWTADLVVILEDLIAKEALALAKYLFCSKVLIVDTQHSRLDYYRAAFDDDSIRVSQKFDQLKAHGAPMLQIPNLSIHKVIDLIKVPNCVAIALVDNSILCPPAGEENSKKSNNDGEKMSYTGHYVLLCGISDNPNDIQKAISVENKAKHTTHCLVLLDPGKEITMYVTVERFEAAWRARGTDEDIIFVAKTIIT
jgi:hypothetical protein